MKNQPSQPPFYPYANVKWTAEGDPISEDYGDVYYSKHDGLAETRYVFIENNHLPGRWLEQPRFTIGELGFGTGLSFLATWGAWRKRSRLDGWLHFVSFELALMRQADRVRALSRWPELDGLSRRLNERLLLPAAGVHRIHFPEDRLSLTLVIGDVRETLPTMRMAANAWFFDGFSPACNESMWSSDLIRSIPNCSAPQCTFASYSITGDFKRSLKASGYRIEKARGFSYKREMLRGTVPGISRIDKGIGEKVIVLGAGMAGCAAAWSLAKRGINVTLLDRRPTIAAEASGNDLGIMMPYLARKPDARTRLAIQGVIYTINLLKYLDSQGYAMDWKKCGVLRLAITNALRSLKEEALENGFSQEFVRGVSAEEASEIAGVPLDQSGLYFPLGSVLSPPKFCKALINDSGEKVNFHESKDINRLERVKDSWEVLTSEGQIFSGDAVVLAASWSTINFAPTSWFPLTKTRGQVVYTETTDALNRLNLALCYDGYTTPTMNGRNVIGSSFEKQDDDDTLRQSTQRDIIEKLTRYMPDHGLTGTRDFHGRVAFRCGTEDHLPIAGPLIDRDRFSENYQTAKYSNLDWSELTGQWQPGLYATIGHGSHGLQMAPLLGEYVASEIAGDPAPLNQDLIAATNALRFLVRQLNAAR